MTKVKTVPVTTTRCLVINNARLSYLYKLAESNKSEGYKWYPCILNCGWLGEDIMCLRFQATNEDWVKLRKLILEKKLSQVYTAENWNKIMCKNPVLIEIQ